MIDRADASTSNPRYSVDFRWMMIADCVLSMGLDLTYNQPLILSSVTGSWYSMDSSPRGMLQLRAEETVNLACPTHPDGVNDFANFPNKNVLQAKCKSGNNFEIEKKVYSFDRLQCRNQVKPTTQNTGLPCSAGLSELIKIGYTISGTFLPVYEACFDKDKKGTIFTEMELSPNYAKNDAPVPESTWVRDNLFGTANLNEEYTCNSQRDTFYKILGKQYFQPGDTCCYAKSKFVDSRDLVYDTQRVATYHYLNSVPQWSTCNNRANWVEVENRVRRLVSNLQRPLRVWTGTFRIVNLRNKWLLLHSDMYLHYNSKTDRAQPIPLYIWKVVHDPQTRRSLAIIYINKPDLVQSNIESYVLCQDVCQNVNWMNFLSRQTVASGYVYCCDLNDFEFGFHITNSPFPKNAGAILRDDSHSSW
ncbi:hypothetical protein EVAR_59834_1 [Eumeta japonica]|uniref:DNA/RNA non-specific endonuclease/pyrophosphatase/phosphodiesterase domain-containing protein n=1 Tax=Eumeta variegata TaxID=151549 RepID=A0A4C1Z526_EUMVA|nr:hypothetical protein EVAR_59834_1 [Eumeta japonica]